METHLHAHSHKEKIEATEKIVIYNPRREALGSSHPQDNPASTLTTDSQPHDL